MSNATEFVDTDIRAVMLDEKVVTVVYSDGGQVRLLFASVREAKDFFVSTEFMPRADRISADASGEYIQSAPVRP